MREKIEFWLVVDVARVLGMLPRRLARRFADGIAWSVYRFHGRLRRVGERNIELAVPQLSRQERKLILHGVFRHLGWQLLRFELSAGERVVRQDNFRVALRHDHEDACQSSFYVLGCLFANV